MTCWQTDH